MKVGFIGAGNMARALARGWGEPVLCSDAGSGRAAELARELGGEAASNVDVARRADMVVLAHKPAQLERVAGEIAGEAKAVVSLLARTPLRQLRAAYPDTPVIRVQANLPVELRRGVTVVAQESDVDVDELFAQLGAVVRLPESALDAAAACSAVGPAYWTLVVEAQVDAAIRRGVPAAQASVLVTETMAGTAELLRARGNDTLGLRREVTSPGGTTARGLAALERGGIRSAFAAALDDVLDRA